MELSDRAKTSLLRAGVYCAVAALIWGGLRYYGSLRLSAAAAEREVAAEEESVEGRLGKRLLPEALIEAGFSASEAAAAAHALGRVQNVRRLSADDRYIVKRSSAGALMHLTWVHGLKRVVVTQGAKGKFRAAASEVALKTRQRGAAGVIEGSLWASMDSAGVPAEVIVRFAQAYEWTIDFLSEPRNGDRFSVVWSERTSPDGKTWDHAVQAGIYDGKLTGRRQALLFDDDYYDEKGESLRRVFLRAPLQFARVSSGFASRRAHPILRINRPHHGTDYAASRGTPVSAVADGVIVVAHRERGFGNVVKIRHDGTYLTLYGHLHRFGAGIRQGMRVKQGRVIGTVGSTGLATGPHLHFQIEKNGRWVDFLKLDLPFARSIPKAQHASFAEARRRLQARLSALAPGEKARVLED
jgi:murein DD-endopeptidase MepM/ murein hydrolase activator NlpD